MELKKSKILTEKEQQLIAISAAVAGNCHRSLRYHFMKAIEKGCKFEEIEEAVDIARSVRQRPINDIYEVAINLLSENRDDLAKKVMTD